MPKKRVVLNIEQSDYTRLLQDARGRDMTVSNLIRAALGLPLEHQGKKRADPPPATRKRSTRKRP